ncbi:hypothetical protein [Paraburkholderia heleia]|uniref:hypothetical protein n=1 Tax=Paraburkholderia heleia TaxID=634127 RepID=UPI0012EE5EB9|nr:hypothetical protein [Paraburkholderia heleia]
MDPTWLGIATGTIVLAIAVAGVAAHYFRERRRADYLRNFDHHAWWQRTHGAACASGGVGAGRWAAQTKTWRTQRTGNQASVK